MSMYTQKEFQFDYLFKIDDDAFLYVDKLLEVTNSLPKSRVFWGSIWKGVQAVLDGRWADKEYADAMGHRMFDPYQSGAGYLISSDIVKYLSSAEKHVGLRHFNNEDVTMGHWISVLKVDPLSAKPGAIVNLLTFEDSNEKCAGSIVCHKRTPAQMRG
eukprot:8910_1